MYDDAHKPNDYEEDATGENVRFGNAETKSNERIFQDTPPDFVATMRNLRVEMKSYKEDNERLVKAQEDQNHLNASMLQILEEIQRKMSSGHRAI